MHETKKQALSTSDNIDVVMIEDFHTATVSAAFSSVNDTIGMGDRITDDLLICWQRKTLVCRHAG